MDRSRDAGDVRQTLRIIHAALLGGILTFGAIVLFLLVSGRVGSGGGGVLRWVWLALAVTALFAAGVLRGRLRPEAPARQAQTTAIMVWALAELPALTGLVFALVSGDLVPAIGGLVIGLALLTSHRPATFLTGRRPA
jgi:hypothetical protein